jgi:hypothetical protein
MWLTCTRHGKSNHHAQHSDAAVYIFVRGDVRIILPVFVDDMTFASTSLPAIKQAIADLSTHFKLRDLGPTTELLGIKIDRHRTKRSLTYIKGTMDYAITYVPDPSMSQLFTTYSDVNHGGCKDTGRSSGAYIVKIGSGVVSWQSKRQSIVIVALSTTEAEYMAACEAGKEIVWMRKMLQELGFPMPTSSVLYMDNQSAIQVAKHPEHHGRMKQLDLSWFWLRDVVDQGTISPTYVPTGDMTADLLTKALPRLKVEYFCKQMGLGPSRES